MTQNFRLSIALLLTLLWVATPCRAAVLELSGPAGARVSVNDRPRGYFPLEHPLDLGAGHHVITCTLPGHKDYKSVVFIASEDDWKRLHVRLTPFSRRTAVASNIILAGLGQHYLDKSFKGWLFNIAEAGGLVTALAAESSRVNHRKDYLLLKDKYDSAINSNDVAYYRTLTEQAYADMQDMEDLRDTGLLVAGGAIVLSMLDALILFPAVEAGPGLGPIQDSDSSALDTGAHEYFTTVHAGIKLAF